MSCYVDPLMNHGWRLGPSCHLFADTLEELQTMARHMGMRAAWIQWPARDRRAWAHYDLTASRRRDAVRMGAIELDRNQTVSKWAELNEKPEQLL